MIILSRILLYGVPLMVALFALSHASELISAVGTQLITHAH